MNILFVHEGIGQFLPLHNYLNATGLANSWIGCSQAQFQSQNSKIKNLLPISCFSGGADYYYVSHLAELTKRSFGVKKLLIDALKTHPIDVVVCHGTGGYPLQLFDEFDIPVVTYIEFPSYAAHGNDVKYPPPEVHRYVDKLFEMGSFHQVLKSDLSIVPSEYTRRMFPEILRPKVFAQFEGFDFDQVNVNERREGPLRIGFAARDLSSAKGVEDFMAMAKALEARLPNAQFHICGGKTTFYSFESEFIKSLNKGPEYNFFDYLVERERLTFGETYYYHEFLPYEEYGQFLDDMDIMLYPLRHGSLNWGIIEMLMRGKVVIASDRCFIPEIIEDDVNGFIRNIDVPQSWIELVVELAFNPSKRQMIGQQARLTAMKRFSIAEVAPKFLNLFNLAIQQKLCQR